MRIEARWSGPIDVSADRLPRFGTVPGTRIHYGAGYSGNGVGPSWLGGQILASLALGTRDEWSSLPLVERPARRLPPEPLRYVGGRLVRWGTLSVEESHGAGRRPPTAARLAAAIPRLLRMPIGVRWLRQVGRRKSTSTPQEQPAANVAVSVRCAPGRARRS